MSGELNAHHRRSVLRGLAAATALALPSPPAGPAAEASPDASLLALGRQWAASRIRLDETERLLEEDDRYVQPDVPEALHWVAEDHMFFNFGSTIQHYETKRRWFAADTVIEEIRHEQFQWVSRSDRREKAIARRDAIVAANDEWNAADDREEDACGLTAARAADDAEVTVNKALLRRIIETPARTFEGVLLKARVVAWCCRGLAEIEEELAQTTDATDHVLQLSIARDLVAMIEPDRVLSAVGVPCA